MIKLTDAKNGMPVFINPGNIALVTRDLGKTIILVNGGMVAVKEETDEIIKLIEGKE